MKINNEGSALKLEYGGEDFEVPAGKSDISDEGLGAFIIRKAKEWNMKISKIGDSDKRAVKPIEEIKEIVPEEETPKVEKPKKTTKKK